MKTIAAVSALFVSTFAIAQEQCNFPEKVICGATQDNSSVSVVLERKDAVCTAKSFRYRTSIYLQNGMEAVRTVKLETRMQWTGNYYLFIDADNQAPAVPTVTVLTRGRMNEGNLSVREGAIETRVEGIDFCTFVMND